MCADICGDASGGCDDVDGLAGTEPAPLAFPNNPSTRRIPDSWKGRVAIEHVSAIL